MNKSQVQERLKDISHELFVFFESYDPVQFNAELIPGKWTAAQHLQHLTSSAKILAKALSLPKIFLWYKFGQINREERDYDTLQKKYKAKLAEVQNLPQPRQFDPRNEPTMSKDKLLKNYRLESEKLNKQFGKWSEDKMSKYVLPHPLLGKMSIREIMMFTCFHTDHHLQILKEKYI